MSKIRFLTDTEHKPFGIIIADDDKEESVFLDIKAIKKFKTLVKDFEKVVKA